MEHQIIAAYAQVAATVVIGLAQLGMIGWGLWRMGQTSKERNLQLDQQGAGLKDMGQALRDQSDVLAAMGQALRDQGQGLAAMGQALRDQGQGLAELLRRTP